jgi:hypothetical protein
VAATIVTACSAGTEPGACTEPVQLTISDGLVPQFAWTPDCKVAILSVQEQGTARTMWFAASTTFENEIPTPVIYGVNPAGSDTTMAPVPLTSGGTYRVSITYNDNGMLLPAANERFDR